MHDNHHLQSTVAYQNTVNYSMGGGENKNEVIETDCSIRLLRLESDGEQLPSNLPSRKAYRDDYYALIINGKKNPSVPLDMGRYGEYDPHTVEYQIYRGEPIHSCGGSWAWIPSHNCRCVVLLSDRLQSPESPPLHPPCVC